MADQSPLPRWLRTILAAISGKPALIQRPEDESEMHDEEEEESIEDSTDKGPEDAYSDASEDEASVGGTSEDDGTAHNSPKDNAALGNTTRFINAISTFFAEKATHVAVRTRDAVASAIDRVKRLGIAGVSRAVCQWVKQHPWDTALILVPLLALAIVAIALSAIGFGSAGIVAGMSHQSGHRKTKLLTSW